MQLKIPTEARLGAYLKPCELGLDLPAWFVADLQSIDPDLYPIFHKYSVMWDDFMSNHYGSLDDPRHVIGVPSGFTEEVWGYPKKQDKSNAPVLDGTFHIWRLAKSVGAWAHIVQLVSKDPVYLQFVLDTLHFQAVYSAKYGHKALNRQKREQEQEQRQKEQSNKDQLFNDVNKANGKLIRDVMDNMDRGITAPTNPTKESILSYPNQKNRTKIITPLDDRSGGLIIPDDWEKN